MRLVTVPHTGTVFARALLECWGMLDERYHAGEGSYMSHHTDEFPVAVPDGPTIVCLRDPMLAELSRDVWGWGMPVQHWERLCGLDAHYLRVQLPGGVTAADEIGRLSAFLGSEPEIWPTWEPRNSRGLYDTKRLYLVQGHVPRRLRPAWDYLCGSDRVRDLFDSNGYDLPWMNTSRSQTISTATG